MQRGKDGEHKEYVEQDVGKFIKSQQQLVFQRVEFTSVEKADFVESPETVLRSVQTDRGSIR